MKSNEQEVCLAASSRVHKIVVKADEEGLMLQLTLNPLDASQAIILEFSGVVNLRFLGEQTNLSQIVLLMAQDVSTRGMENIKYIIRDYEEEFILFACSGFRTEQ